LANCLFSCLQREAHCALGPSHGEYGRLHGVSSFAKRTIGGYVQAVYMIIASGIVGAGVVADYE
jgi:hypothetical protein